MISFACRCGEKFSLGDKEAGTHFQCPKCFRLVSVPALDDLASLDDNGAFILDESSVTAPRRRDLIVPAKSSIIAPAELETSPESEPAEKRPPPPRYDPETGERIKLVDVAEFVPSPKTYLPRDVKIHAPPEPPPPPDAWQKTLREMLAPWNLFILLAMSVLYISFAFTLFMVSGAGLGFVVIFPVLAILFSVSYFSLVVQETGPGKCDSLPTPYRNIEFGNDVWLPFVHVFFALMVCYGPTVVAFINIDNPWIAVPVSSALALVGTFLFPAIMMTGAVGGISANLAPHRIWSVIIVCADGYKIAAAAWGLGFGLMALSVLGMFEMLVRLFRIGGMETVLPWWLPPGWLSFVLLYPGLYFSHYACWLMGILWRQHHEQFLWVAQKFEKDYSKEIRTAPD